MGLTEAVEALFQSESRRVLATLIRAAIDANAPKVKK